MKQKATKKDCFGVEQEGDVIDAVDRFRDELANGVETYLWGPESDDEDNDDEEEGRDGAEAETSGNGSGRYGSHDGSFSAQPKQRDRDKHRTSWESVDGSKRTRREMGTDKWTVGSKARYWKDRLEEQIDYTMGFQNDGGMCSNGSTSRCYTCRIDESPQCCGVGCSIVGIAGASLY